MSVQTFFFLLHSAENLVAHSMPLKVSETREQQIQNLLRTFNKEEGESIPHALRINTSVSWYVYGYKCFTPTRLTSMSFLYLRRQSLPATVMATWVHGMVWHSPGGCFSFPGRDVCCVTYSTESHSHLRRCINIPETYTRPVHLDPTKALFGVHHWMAVVRGKSSLF